MISDQTNAAGVHQISHSEHDRNLLRSQRVLAWNIVSETHVTNCGGVGLLTHHLLDEVATTFEEWQQKSSIKCIFRL